MTSIKWRTIGSAPRDGTFVLLCRNVDADNKQMSDDACGIFTQVAAWWGSEGWVVYCSMVCEPTLHFSPTHWAPLPKMPRVRR